MDQLILERLIKVQQGLADNQAWLISTPSDITYFSGFIFLVPEEREAFLVITKTEVFLIHTTFSEFVPHQKIRLLPGCYPQKLAQHLKDIVERQTLSEIHLDKSSLFVEEYEVLQKELKISLHTLAKKPIYELRMVKDAQELEATKKAAQIANQSFAALLPYLKVGVSELELKVLLESEMTKRGSEKPAFPTIVCFGPNSALPHHQPLTDTTLKSETPILFDFGATYKGYRSDMTRTIWFGQKPTTLFKEIENLVHQAYDKALASLSQENPTAQIVDQAARNLITEAGYGPQFIHTTGHGVGLDIHELPSINWNNPTALTPGMVITIEPGIYIEGEFGYRYENTVVVTDSQPQEVTL